MSPRRPIAGFALAAACAVATPAAGQYLCNAGFESPALSAGGTASDPVGAGWIFDGAGVTRPQAGCDGCQSETPAPQQLQVGLLTGTGEVCQTIVRLVPSGTYLIEWQHAGRADAASSTVGCATCDGPTPYDVDRDGVLMDDYTAEQIGEESYSEAGTKFFATATSHEICFVGTGASEDEATFIDHVVVLLVDEIFSDGFECTFGLWSAVTGAS